MTELDIFLSECQTKAEQGIARMESEILSSWAAVFDRPALSYSNYDFSVPSVPEIDEFTLETEYQQLMSNVHSGHTWATGESQYLWDQIHNAFVSGGIGLSNELQNSLFQKDRDRKLQTLNDSLNAVNARIGSRGFGMINSVLAGQRNELIQKYQFDMENQSREILSLMEEHARTNWQFCVERGLSFEQFHADFTNKYDSLFLEMIRTSLAKYQADIEAEVTAYKTKVDSIAANLMNAKLRIDASAVGLGAELEKAKLDVDIAAKDATISVQSHTSEVSRVAQAYSSYADLVKSFAQTAMGGRLDITTYKG